MERSQPQPSLQGRERAVRGGWSHAGVHWGSCDPQVGGLPAGKPWMASLYDSLLSSVGCQCAGGQRCFTACVHGTHHHGPSPAGLYTMSLWCPKRLQTWQEMGSGTGKDRRDGGHRSGDNRRQAGNQSPWGWQSLPSELCQASLGTQGGSKTQGSASSSHMEALGHAKPIVRLVLSDMSVGGDPGAACSPSPLTSSSPCQ